jgi:hypothetical protein
MRALNRPMFRYGGPIKEGVMSGIREPKKNGGKMLLVGQHPKEFRDASGREKHWIPLLGYGAAALRAIPTIYRGFKAARTFGPGKLGKWGRVKDTLLGSGRFRNTTSQVPQQGNILTPAQIKAGMIPKMETTKMGILQALKDPKRFGMALREYPVTALTAATLPATAVDLTREHGKDVAKGGWNLIKRFGAGVIPGDQSHWYKDKPPVKDVPLNPNLQKNLQKEVPVIDEAAAEEAALAKRQKALNERIKKYRDIMDIKGMNKQAAYKSLVDASKLIQESGDFKKDIKSGKLINQVIQAASKQFDKPAQASKAVDTLILQNELKKDLSAETDALDKLYKQGRIAVDQKTLNPSFSDMKVAARKNMDGQSAWDAAAASTSNNFRGNIIPNSEWVKIKKDIKDKSGEVDDITIIANWTTETIKDKNVPDGDYTVGDALVTIQNNQVTNVNR